MSNSRLSYLIQHGLVGIHVESFTKRSLRSLHLPHPILRKTQHDSYLLKRREVLQAQIEIPRLMQGIRRSEMQLENLELLHGSQCKNHLRVLNVPQLC